MTQDALYDLIYTALAHADNLFELWLTVTFAAILAIYFSRAQISPFMRNLLMLLYAGTAVLLTGRWASAMFQISTYMTQIAENGCRLTSR